MTDDMVPTSESEQTLVDDETRKKWVKKEQKLLEQLREAQEAEARALERFRRVQARLQRRKARIERLKSKLLHLRQHMAEDSAEQQAAGLKEVAILMNGAQGAVLVEVDQAQGLPEGIGNGSNTGQLHETYAYAVEQGNSPTQTETAEGRETQIDRDVEPVATPVVIEAEEAGTEENVEVDETQVPTAALPRLEIVAEDGEEPVVGEGEEGGRVDDAQAEPAEFSPGPERLEADVEPTPVKEEEWIEFQGSGESDVTLSLAQIAAKAKEEWVVAETAVQQARNVAHGIAAGIGFLTQTDISNELMQELLRKQGDANKVLVKVQETARLAYARFIQAQEAAEATSSKQEDHENGFLPTTIQEVADSTTQMHAIHLRKDF